VIRVLTEDHHLHVAVRREVQGREDVVGRRIHRTTRALVGHERLQFLPIRLGELIPENRVPVGRGHPLIVAHAGGWAPTA